MIFALALLLSAPQRVSDSILPTGARVRPAGQVVLVPGRPVDAVFSRDGTRAYVKDQQGLRIIDLAAGKEIASLASPGGTSLTGLALNGDGTRLFLTSATTKLHEIDVTGEKPRIVRSIELPGPNGKGNSFPCGVTLSPDGQTAYVCLSIKNSLGFVDLAIGKLTKEVEVGIAPYQVAIDADMRATVSLMGGPLQAAIKTATSAGTPTPVDNRGVATQGGLAVVDLQTGKRLRVTATGRQTSAVATLPSGQILAAHTNDDRVATFDPALGKELISTNVKPEASLPFGSMPSSVAVSPDPNVAFVALAGNNAVAVVNHATKRVLGFIPAGWYTTAVAVHGRKLLIASAKGLGSRRSSLPAMTGRNSYDYSGTIQTIDIPDAAELARLTKQVIEDVHAPQILRAFDRVARSKAKPVPVPKRLGDPSPIQHVVYVIKENRTYDQILGDMKTGDGDPRLCVYPESVTPNHHALAREFVQLDNYYCNGVLSADGHSWATEGNVTPYLERAFGGFNRSYTFGDDPLTYSSSGFLWDRVLDAGLSFRNFGEMDYAEPPAGMKIKELLKARGGAYPKFKHNIGVERLRRYSDPEYPGWNMEIPDVVRLDRFFAEFRRYEKEGGFPNLTIVYLPQDHTGSSVTNRANVADNDLAIGKLIETLSHSKRYWPTTAVFINEDDPQGGFDHVDGHRSICFVASPYTRNRGLVSAFYNQTSALHTMLRILGLPPLNQRDASSPLMTACFKAKPNLTPYKARPVKIALDETTMPGQTTAFMAFAKKQKARLEKIPRGHKTRADEEMLNRLIWWEAKGWKTPYPAKWAGPHGRGLKRRGLTHVDGAIDDDDDE